MITLLEKFFPPRLPRLHLKNDLKEVLSYRYRISRTGIEANPNLCYGGQVIAVREGRPAPKLKRGHA